MQRASRREFPQTHTAARVIRCYSLYCLFLTAQSLSSTNNTDPISTAEMNILGFCSECPDKEMLVFFDAPYLTILLRPGTSPIPVNSRKKTGNTDAGLMLEGGLNCCSGETATSLSFAIELQQLF